MMGVLMAIRNWLRYPEPPETEFERFRRILAEQEARLDAEPQAFHPDWEGNEVWNAVRDELANTDPSPGLTSAWPLPEDPRVHRSDVEQRAAFDRALEMYLTPYRNTRSINELWALEAAFRAGWISRHKWSN